MLPEGRFFTPKPAFWDYLKTLRGIRIIECGAGSGDLISEAEQHGLAITANDICRRPGQDPRVRSDDATALDWSPTLWPLICRPSHDGWANEVADRAQTQGSYTLWVGLPRNFEKDLSCYGPKCKLFRDDVGEDGERLYIIKPKKG
jgi:hypothetical protein